MGDFMLGPGPSIVVDGHLVVWDGVGGRKTKDGGAVPGGGSSDLVKLGRFTASGSATLDATSTLAAGTYRNYLVLLEDLLPATNGAVLTMRFSTNNGSTWDNSNIYVPAMHQVNQGTFDAAVNPGSPNTSGLISWTVSNSANNGVCGNVWLLNPGGASYKRYTADVTYLANDGNYYSIRTGGLYPSTTAVTAFQLLFTSGNIASGSFTVYGLKL